jgi:DNA-binding NarL/FixJ family response regulator
VIRILLVDDHPVVRKGIKQILVDGMTGVVVGEASDGQTGLAQIQTGEWDLVVLDVSMPGISGLDVLKQVRREQPSLPIVVLSMHPANQFARRLLAAGATAYLTKDSAPTALVEAIEAIRSGRGRLAGSRAVPSHDGRGQAPHDALSDREFQVLRMLGSGLTASAIAADLRLSVKTVSTYRSRVLEKLQMHSNAELMRYAIENRLLDS